MRKNFIKCQEIYPDIKFHPIPKADACLVGILERFGGFVELVYDAQKLKEKLIVPKNAVLLFKFKSFKKACAANPELDFLKVDGFDNCFLGVVKINNLNVFAYDRCKILQTLMFRDGATDEEALDYFDFNIIGSYVGEKTPAFITKLRSIY